MAYVLIIDDEPHINFVLKTLLVEEGHHVITAQDGLSGLKKLNQSPLPEIVFVDLRMPIVSGRAIVETMHNDPRFSSIPVVIMSGYLPNNKDFPPDSYYTDMLAKPFDIYEVLKKVESLTG